MKFVRRKLKNGITVLYEKRDLPIISLSITNPLGAIHETSDIKGIAHLIEHLVFTGTKKRSHEDISREIEKRGGILNAFTDHVATSFWFKLPAKHIYSGLDILTDLLNNPKFEEKKFEKEKKVIIEEIKMYHDIPQYHIYEKILENLYDKPFGEGIIGSEKTITSLTKDKVIEFFKNNYRSSNYIVSMVGKADFNRVCKYLEKNFKKSEKNLKIDKIVKINKHTEEHRPGLDQAHFIFGIHAPHINEKDYYAFDLLDTYLAKGMSSKLFLSIREERGLAYSVKSTFDSKKHYSNYTIYVGTTKQALDEVKKLILIEFENVKNMTEKDLEESKEHLIGLRKISMEESVNVMNELVFAELANKAEDYYNYEKNIKKVKLDEVKRLAIIKDYSTAVISPP